MLLNIDKSKEDLFLKHKVHPYVYMSVQSGPYYLHRIESIIEDSPTSKAIKIVTSCSHSRFILLIDSGYSWFGIPASHAFSSHLELCPDC